MKSQPKYSAAKLVDKLHYHACSECRHRYWDNCSTPTEDARCRTCITGYSTLADVGTQPRSCCLTDTKPATNWDRLTYRLAGQGPWYMCKTCSRQFGYLPKAQP